MGSLYTPENQITNCCVNKTERKKWMGWENGKESKRENNEDLELEKWHNW